MIGRLVLLSTSPRVAPGLLSWHAWSVLREGRVVAADEHHPLLAYLLDADIEVEILAPAGETVLAQELLARAAHADPLVFVLPQVGEETFARALTTLLIGAAAAPAVEVLPGSYDLPGARLLDLVATMDRLRSPGGCPWDAEQTHESLVTYLLEETYETIEAIETGDRDHLREELGDLLLQVMFHSRIAAEDTESPWSVDDVAGDIVDKLVRRHPHVFAALAPSAGAPTPQHRRRATSKRAGRRSRRRKRAATRRSRACRWASRRWRSPPSSCIARAPMVSRSRSWTTTASVPG